MIKNIIFDIGGVMFDDSTENVNNILGRDSKELCKKIYGKGFRECILGNMLVSDYVETFKNDTDYELIKDISTNLNIFYPIMRTNFEYISKLKDKGYKLYILSNITKESYEYVNKTINIDSIFEGGIYSYQEGLRKPDKEIFELLLNKYNLKREECIFFDDKIRNVESANELGIKSYVFNSIKDIEDVL